MKTFIVSIEEDNSLRLQKLFNQPYFKKGVCDYLKVGIRGAELSAKQYFELGVKGRSRPLSPNMVGCTLSHLEALQEFLKTGDQYGLIIEDDAVFPENLSADRLDEEVKRLALPSNTLFSIGGILMKECRKVRGTVLDELFLGKRILRVAPDFYHRICYAVAYIVDRQIAQTLIAYHRPLRAADDWRYLADFDSTVSVLMAAVIDHPVICAGELNAELSTIEHERIGAADLPVSKYGNSFRYTLSKMKFKKYPL